MEGSGALSHLVEAATALARLTESTVSRAPEPSAPIGTTSVISDEEESRVVRSKEIASASKSGLNGKREIFPQRLLAILNDKSLTDIITWLPHGRSFVIIRPDVFTEKVLPKYLPPADARASTKYPSFTRKLNRW